MVHSIELVFDDDTESTIRRLWAELAAIGMSSPPPAARPHVTLAVAQRIDKAADAALAPIIGLLPLDCALGASLTFGRSHGVLARLVVPTAELLDLHAEAYRRSAPYLEPGPMANVLPGRWTPHVTLARRVGPAQLGRAQRIAGRSDSVGRFVGLRHWDGTSRTAREI